MDTTDGTLEFYNGYGLLFKKLCAPKVNVQKVFRVQKESEKPPKKSEKPEYPQQNGKKNHESTSRGYENDPI
jgi:hypothetical protein